MAHALVKSPDYAAWLCEMKSRVRSAHLSAARAVNRDMILLYWDIGRGILEKQQEQGWGKSVVDRLAADLRKEFPHISGFSARNLWNMRRLVEAYSNSEVLAQAMQEIGNLEEDAILRQPVAELESDRTEQAAEFLQQLVAEIPWGHNLLILNKISDFDARLYYLRATAQFGWTRNVLLNQIKAGAYQRSLAEGKTHNFPSTLARTSGRTGGRSPQEFVQSRISGDLTRGKRTGT